MSIHQHSPLACDCKSGDRTLVLLAPNFAVEFSELSAFGENENWQYDAAYGIVLVEVGSAKRWSGAAEVANFLRTVITDETRLKKIRAAWLDRRLSLAEQLVKIVTEAETLTRFAEASEGASELLDILQNRRIESWFQPVVDTRNNRIWGYECLMRGRRKDGTLVGAPQLLEWANSENLKFMLDRVCRETHLENAGRLNFSKDCRFLINFLPTAIYQPEYCLQTSLAAMRRSGLVASQVTFEVVETEQVQDSEHLLRILDFYRRSGFGIALDDLGSGYSGLNMLGDLNPDLIKIDREMVSKAVTSKSHFNICAALAKIGQDNNQLVLAEGVETKESVALMQSLGIYLFQGYYFGKPQPQPETTINAAIPAPPLVQIEEMNTFH